jgi:hypothetical protein
MFFRRAKSMKREDRTLGVAPIVPRALSRAAILVLLCAVTICLPIVSSAQTRSARESRTASVHWDQVPLGDGLDRIAATYGAAILLDRRVDPTGRISLGTQDANLTETLNQAAAAAGLGASQIDGLHYVGPTAITDELRTLSALRNDEADHLPAAIRNSLLEKKSLSWPRRAEPGALAVSAASARGWQLAGAERIPHDLWDEGRLPALMLPDQLTVLLAGFNLTFRYVQGTKSIEIVPLEEPYPRVSLRYRLRYGAADAERLQEQFPFIQLQQDGDWAVVDARVEEHQRLSEWLAGPQARPAVRPPSRPGIQVYALRVEEQPVRAILNALIQRENWPLEADEESIRAAGLSLDQRVTFDVKDASQEVLLRAILEPAGLDFRREGDRIKIVPRGGDDK